MARDETVVRVPRSRGRVGVGGRIIGVRRLPPVARPVLLLVAAIVLVVSPAWMTGHALVVSRDVPAELAAPAPLTTETQPQ